MPKSIKFINEDTKHITCESCGEKVYLLKFTNTCICGVDYNFAGQMLAPREQWGEETGEPWQDCY